MTEYSALTKVETLVVLAKDDKKRRKEFYEALLDISLYTFGTLESEKDALQGTVKLRYFQGDSRWILPIFTRISYMQEAIPSEISAITIQGKKLFEIIDPDATVVLNIGTEVSKTFTPEEIKDIASGRIFTLYS
ncbi:SseB family protein [Ectobacillus sp. sgz5001026]|uniref:SseB family protein n=1 Tax=Ectobacillus sp. sgz5001026 TaxID=3242473 RepID=UPI0036D3C59B